MKDPIQRASTTALWPRYLPWLLLVSAMALLPSCAAIIGAGTDEPIQTDPGKRPFGTYINDENLEVIARINLDKAHPDLKKASIQVNVFNGVALLTGQVASESLRRLAAATVNDINSVRQLHNELQVQGNLSLLSQTNDTWLAHKVKAKLLAHREVQGSRIKVIAEDGAIYLMGLVSRAEAEKVTGIVSSTSGIQQVVRVFEYIDINR